MRSESTSQSTNSAPKRWQVGAVTLIVFAPFYAWLIPTLAYNGQRSLRLAIVVFWVYLFLGYFVVKAILKRMTEGKEAK